MTTQTGAAPAPPRLRHQSLVLIIGEVTGRIMAFLAVISVTRAVSPEAWGIVALASGASMYLAKVADFGVETVGIDEVAKQRQRVGHLASVLLSVRMQIAVGMVAIGALWASVALEGLERLAFLLYFLTLVPVAASTRWVHLGLEHATPVAIWRVVSDTLSLLGVVLFVRASGDVWRFPLILAGAELLNVTMLAGLLVRQGHGLKWQTGWTEARPVLRRAMPVTVQTLLGLAIYNANLIILRLMWTRDDVGYYATAFAVLSFVSNVIVAHSTGALPSMSRSAHRVEEAQKVIDNVTLRSLAIAFPMAVGGTLLAADLMVGVYGPQYARSGALLTILLWSMPFAAFRVAWFYVFIAFNRQDMLLRTMTYGAICSTILNGVLIARYGGRGAAWATVLTDVFMAGLMLYDGTRFGLRLPSWRRIAKPGAGCVAMAAVVVAGAAWPWTARLVAGAAVYATALLAIGAVRIDRHGLSVPL